MRLSENPSEIFRIEGFHSVEVLSILANWERSKMKLKAAESCRILCKNKSLQLSFTYGD
jgi:hypothetical protein